VPSTAHQEYTARRDARIAVRDALTAVDARLATFVSGVVLAGIAWNAGFSFWWLLAPVSLFLWLVQRHDRVLRARELAIRGIEFYNRGLGKLGS
jgi:cyanate permease